MSVRVSAGRQFVIAAVAAYSGYPRTTQRLANEHLSESHEYCCEHAGGVSRNAACVDPATPSVERAAAQRCSQPDTRWRR